MASEHYDDLFLDYVFGLLDEHEAEALRGHLAGCDACRTALAEAEKHRHLLARAARVIEEVPAFVVPGQDEESGPQAPPQDTDSSPPSEAPAASPARETSALPATLAFPERKKRRLLLRYWPGWAAAAAILVAALALNNAYQEGLASRQGQIAQLQSEVKAVDDRFAVLQKKVAISQQDKARLAIEQTPPQLTVLAPAQMVGDAPAPIRVTARDVNGKLKESEVTATFANANGEVLEKLTQRIPGEGTLQLLGAKAASARWAGAARLRVATKVGRHEAKVEETLRVAQPEHVTHLALNKSIYRTGEMLFFRTLTLERYSLKPPVRALPLRFALVDPAGRAVQEMVWQTGPGGISGGEIALTTDLYAGNYTFQVSAADGNNAVVLPEERDLQIVGDQLAQATVAQAAIANNTSAAKDAKKPLEPVSQPAAEAAIEFFPEGGDLVAGLASRVYYRVQSPQADTGSSEGRVIVRAGQKVIHDAEPQHGLGWFTLTPDPKETYSVHLDLGTRSLDIANPLERLGIKPEGLVLHAPQSVSRDGDPIPLVFRNQGPARQLWLQATCRGQLVDQRFLSLPPGSKEITLQPPAGVAGIVRATVWDAATARLVPLAERLLYRIPAKRLDVACEITNGPGPYAAGAHVKMKLKATDEGQGAPHAWMSAVVVDEKYRLERKERSLAAHFYLAGDVAGEELDNADLALTDTPASWQALDLFLGTQGWRRFVPAPANIVLATAKPALPTTSARNEAALGNGLYSLQSESPQTLVAYYQKNFEREVGELISGANQERASLIEQKETRLVSLGQALRELADFRDLPAEYLRLGLGVLALVLLVAGASFLTLGLVRLVRKREESPTPCFAGAFSCLFACLLLYLVAGRMPLDASTRADARALEEQPDWPEFKAPNVAPPAPSPSSPPVGFLALETRPRAGLLAEGLHKKADANLQFGAVTENFLKQNDDRYSRAQSLSLNRGQNSYSYGDLQKELRDGAANQATPNQSSPNQSSPNQATANQITANNQELKSRYDQVAASQVAPQFRAMQTPAAKMNLPAPTAPGGLGGGGFGGPASAKAAKGAAAFGGGIKGGMEAANAANPYFREYAHRNVYQRSRADFQDTVLWYPFLNCPAGEAQVSFDLPYNPASYRVLIYANDAEGRLGFYEETLDVLPGSRKGTP
jgi:hypothetical protein